MSRVPMSAVLGSAGCALGIGFAIKFGQYAVAAAFFTYGLGLALGCIYQAVSNGGIRPKGDKAR